MEVEEKSDKKFDKKYFPKLWIRSWYRSRCWSWPESSWYSTCHRLTQNWCIELKTYHSSWYHLEIWLKGSMAPLGYWCKSNDSIVFENIWSTCWKGSLMGHKLVLKAFGLRQPHLKVTKVVISTYSWFTRGACSRSHGLLASFVQAPFASSTSILLDSSTTSLSKFLRMCNCSSAGVGPALPTLLSPVLQSVDIKQGYDTTIIIITRL